jgi:nitrous oxide reductase accessory protein NosL
MKQIVGKILMFVVIIAIIIVMFLAFGSSQGANYVYKGNSSFSVVPIKPKEYQCSECNMDVEDMKYAAEVVLDDGRTYFFDEIGCLVLWSKDKTNIVKIYTKTVDTHKWIDAHKAYYSRIDNTPMGYGFGAYEHPKSGLISFEKMRELMLQGQNLQDPFVKKSLLGKDLAK